MIGFGTQLLDVAVGMIFVYLVISMIASATVEILETFLRTRAKYLWQGIGELLGDATARGMSTGGRPAKTDAAPPPTVNLASLYQHPIISGLFYDSYENAKRAGARRSLPAYIPRESFSTAVIDLVSRLNPKANMSSIQALRNGVGQLEPGTPVRRALEAITRLAGDDIVLVQSRIEAWYDAAMDRVAGQYKRHSQVMLFIIGLGLAAAVPIDSWRLAQDLLHNEPKREALVKSASDYAAAHSGQNTPMTGTDMQNYLSTLDQFGSPLEPTKSVTLLGLLVTAFAISLGAPFWFDLLNKFMIVRSTVKPKEKSPDEASVDRVASGGSTGGTTSAPVVFVRSGG